MKRVLVTGATGFIGRHVLAPLVDRGFDVHAVTHRTPPTVGSGCTWHVSNVLDTVQIAPLMQAVQPTHLLHLAWYAVPGRYWTALENLAWVQASLELLRRFHDAGGTRVVMAGTCAEYDWSYGYCSEHTTPTQPHTLYGTCKLALQAMLETYARHSGLSSAWGRVFFLYGPHEHPSRLVSSVVQSLLQGEPAPCSHGTQWRDFLHVQDAAGAFVALLDSAVTGPVNIASGQPVKLMDLIYVIADKLNRRDLIRMGALPTSRDEPPLLCADARRLENDVRWSPTYRLTDGLEHTIGWWHDHLSAHVSGGMEQRD
jgi:nucleoside-diphosphate-sugar epimerase